jgi:hypothetical protein
MVLSDLWLIIPAMRGAAGLNIQYGKVVNLQTKDSHIQAAILRGIGRNLKPSVVVVVLLLVRRVSASLSQYDTGRSDFWG